LCGVIIIDCINVLSNIRDGSRDEGDNEGDLYFENCTDARSKGYYNIHRGESGYRPALDRDNDGIACERY